MTHWNPISTAPESTVVETKISDAWGSRNERELKRRGNLWFSPDGKTHVFYQPTHWRASSDELEQGSRKVCDVLGCRLNIESFSSLESGQNNGFDPLLTSTFTREKPRQINVESIADSTDTVDAWRRRGSEYFSDKIRIETGGERDISTASALLFKSRLQAANPISVILRFVFLTHPATMRRLSDLRKWSAALLSSAPSNREFQNKGEVA